MSTILTQLIKACDSSRPTFPLGFYSCAYSGLSEADRPMSVAELAAEEPPQSSGSGMGPRHSRMQYALHTMFLSSFPGILWCWTGA